MTWPMVALGEVADVQMGQAPAGESYVKSGDGVPLIAGAGDFGENEILPKKATSQPTKMCQSGDFVLSIRATIGPKREARGAFCLGRGVAGIRATQKLDRLFLWHALTATNAELSARARGATFLQVNKRDIETLLIPLPPLPEQRRIAGILDAADALRRRRREAIETLDTLQGALFAEMFGGQQANSYASLGTLARVVTGATPPSKEEGMFDGPVPFMTPGDLERNGPAVRNLTEKGANASRTVAGGSTLVCCIGATIGKIDRADQTVAFNQQINALEWGESIRPSYGLHAVRAVRHLIVGRATSTTLPILKKSLFEKLEIPVPPISRQEEFETRIEAMRPNRTAMTTHLARLDALFAALQSRAFSGQL